MPPEYIAHSTKRAVLDAKHLFNLADYYGKKAECVSAMKRMMELLENSPHEWGDPLRKAAKPGGMVYRGVILPLWVEYTVYEPEKKIMITEIKPFPGAGLG